MPHFLFLPFCFPPFWRRNPYGLLALADRENQRLLKAVPCANGVQWFRCGIESGDLKQCDTSSKTCFQPKYALAVDP
jgi:hypothetical protein